MVKVLIKKQLMELGAFFYQSGKKESVVPKVR